ncbi:MAG TPA: NAD-dependent epimerase/dehydratase family protein, partial [Polyangia bacterium]|nr:NAD-dependent epimerase/dehydratase family protein [Polyangia bacterium]
MLALVTGAAGFIGAHVVRALVADGVAVRALHLPGEDLRNLRGLDVERVAGDVTDAVAMRAAVRGCDRVFHLAAIYALWTRDPERMWRVNVDGTRIVLTAARDAGVARVVVTSSIARFGGQGRGVQATEASPFALGVTGDVYSRTKAVAHEAALKFAAEGMHVVLVAPTAPVGPGDVAPTPTGRAILAAATLPVAVVPDSAGNFGDVRDIARGHLLAAERGRSGEAYLLGGRDLTLRELAAEAHAVLGVRRPIVVAPAWAARLAARAAVAVANRTGKPPLATPASVAIMARELRADCGKAVRELGMPQTPVSVALRDAFAWWTREGYMPEIS